MKKIKKYFHIRELVCPHVYEKFGEQAWDFFDRRMLDNLLFIREGIGKPITVNNWSSGGNLSQRGIRCNVCSLVKEKTSLEKVYMSTHQQGTGVDFNVQGMSTQEVHRWIESHKDKFPHPFRIEKNTTTWIHMDVRNYTNNKLIYFLG